ncbi:hypothetical protein OIU78_027941 [Salix suchowensis]|nr:hypothetical protein OIU78_027941 [Salix suchowensis]
MVGRPLSCDSQTYTCRRLEYARLCVELDACLPKVTSFEIVSPLSSEPITVEVEYEWTPPHRPQLANSTGIHAKKSARTSEITLKQNPSPHSHPIPPTDPQPSAPLPTAPIITIVEKPPNGKGKDPQPSATTNLKMKQPMVVVVTHAPDPKPPMLHETLSSNLNQQISQEKKPPDERTQILRQSPKAPLYQLTTNLIPEMNTTITNDEVCHLSKMDSLGSRNTNIPTMEETHEESSASGTAIEEHDQSPPPSPKTVKKKKGGMKNKVAKGY